MGAGGGKKAGVFPPIDLGPHTGPKPNTPPAPGAPPTAPGAPAPAPGAIAPSPGAPVPTLVVPAPPPIAPPAVNGDLSIPNTGTKNNATVDKPTGDSWRQPSAPNAPGKNNMPPGSYWKSHDGKDPAHFMQGYDNLPIGANGLLPGQYIQYDKDGNPTGLSGHPRRFDQLEIIDPKTGKSVITDPLLKPISTPPPSLLDKYKIKASALSTFYWDIPSADSPLRLPGKLNPYSNEPIFPMG